MSSYLESILGGLKALLTGQLGIPTSVKINLSLLIVFGYILLFGDSEFHKGGFVSKLNRLLTLTIPRFLFRNIGKILGKTGRNFLYTIEHYACETAHPLVLIGVFCLWAVGLYVFVTEAVIPFYPGEHFPDIWMYIAYFGISTAIFSMGMAWLTDPGTITIKNYEKYLQLYPADSISFHPTDCNTCEFTRPGRSKHCKLLHKHIAKYDHYCPFIHNTVGERNYRWFLLFLASNSMLFIYGACVFASILWSTTRSVTLCYNPERCFSYQPQNFRESLQLIMYQNRRLAMLALFLGIMGCSVGSFFFYHIYLAWKGTTTNEKFKRKFLVQDFRRWKRTLKRADEKIAEFKLETPSSSSSSSSSTKSKKSKKSNKSKAKTIKKSKKSPKQETETETVELVINDIDEQTVTCLPSFTHITSADAAYINQRYTEQEIATFIAAEKLNSPEHPKRGIDYLWHNPYNMGPKRNFYEIFFPPSIYGVKGSHKKRLQWPEWLVKQLKSE